MGCHLLVYKLLKDQKEKFQSFRLSEATGGVVKQMLQAMSEASMNLLCGDDLRKKAEELEKTEQCGDLPRKLQDLALLMDASVETLEGDTLNENELLLCLEQRIREKHLFCGDLFCFDDFFDFTAAEYRLLDALMSVGADLIFAFPHDAQDRRFRKTTLAMRKIRGMAQSHSIVCDVLRSIGRMEKVLWTIWNGITVNAEHPLFPGTAAILRYCRDLASVMRWKGSQKSYHVCTMREFPGERWGFAFAMPENIFLI